MAATTTSRPSRSGASNAPPKDYAALIKTGASGLPNRYALHAVEGWGKTSLAAQFPKPLFLQSRGETGLETLIQNGRLPEIPHLPEAETWADLLGMLEWIREHGSEYKTLAIDTMNGMERLCHEHVCRRDFENDWTDKGFEGYKRGYQVALADWRQALNLLDAIRLERRITILMLFHTKVATFKNPEGPDFDRYQPDAHAGTWSLTHKWADCVLFGNFESHVVGGKMDEKGGRKGKGQGGNVRILYSERHAAYDAKNRLGLPSEIEMGDSPESAFVALSDAIKAGRRTVQGGEQQ
jgi:hypothetical protein